MNPIKITKNLYQHGTYDSNKHTVLFVHGLAQNHNYLYYGNSRPIDHYHDYNVFSFNYRDYGHICGAKYTIADIVHQDLQQTFNALEEIEKKPFNIVTFSFGGAILLEFLHLATSRPHFDRIHKIVCVSPLNYTPKANQEPGFKYSKIFRIIGLYTCLPLRYIIMGMKLVSFDFSYWKTVNCIPHSLMNEIKNRCNSSYKLTVDESIISRTLLITTTNDLFCPSESLLDFFPANKAGEANVIIDETEEISHKNIFFTAKIHENITGWIQ